MSRPRSAAAPPDSMTGSVAFDYAAPAEMFSIRSTLRGRRSMAYRRFATAAEAIRFVVEGSPPSLRFGVILEVLEQRLDHRAIRDLYNNAAYPFSRG